MPSHEFSIKVKVEEIISQKANTLYQIVDAAAKQRIELIESEALASDKDLGQLEKELEKARVARESTDKNLAAESPLFEAAHAKRLQELKDLAEAEIRAIEARRKELRERGAAALATVNDARSAIDKRIAEIKKGAQKEISRINATRAEMKARIHEKVTSAGEELWIAGTTPELKCIV